MTIPEEPTPIDPPEPEVTEVPETTGPVEVPEPAVTDTPPQDQHGTERGQGGGREIDAA